MSKKTILIILAAVVVIAAGGIAAYLFSQKDERDSVRPANTVDYGPPKKEDSAGVQSDKDKIANGESKPDTGSPTPSPSSSMIVSFTQAQQSDSQVIIRALVDGATSGTCTLTASKSSQTSVTKTAPIGVQANYSICQGFDIPTSEFPASGEWKISITATNASGQTSAAAEKGVTILK